MNMQEVFPEFAPTSASQEEILERDKFVIDDPFPEITSNFLNLRRHPDDGIPIKHRTDDIGSSSNDGIPIKHRTDDIGSSSSNPIILSPSPDCHRNQTDFIVDIRGVVHLPSEVETYFVSPLNVDVVNCSFKTTNDQTLHSNNLGFPENSPCVGGNDGLAEMDCDVQDLGEPPLKKKRFSDILSEVKNKNHNLLEIAKRKGMTFAAPSWRPKTKPGESKLFNYSN